MKQLFRLYPHLEPNEAKTRLGPSGIARRALCDPVGFAVYSTVLLLVRSPPANTRMEPRTMKGPWSDGASIRDMKHNPKLLTARNGLPPREGQAMKSS